MIHAVLLTANLSFFLSIFFKIIPHASKPFSVASKNSSIDAPATALFSAVNADLYSWARKVKPKICTHQQLESTKIAQTPKHTTILSNFIPLFWFQIHIRIIKATFVCNIEKDIIANVSTM